MPIFTEIDGEPRVGRIIGGIVIAVLVVSFGGWGLSVALAPLFGAGNAYKQTETADYRIQNYEKFKDDCNAIIAQDVVVQTAQDAVDSQVKGQVNSFNEQRLSDNLNAAKNVRAGMITQYNADASKNKTKAKFRDAGLPDHIEPNMEIGALTCPSS